MKPHYKSVSGVKFNLFNIKVQNGYNEFEYPWHFHPEYELTFVKKGNGERFVGNNIENFSDFDLVLIGSNLPHCWINSKNQKEPPQAMVIYLQERFISWIQSSEFDAIRKLLESSGKGIKFDKAVALKMKERFSDLLVAPPLERIILLLRILQELTQTSLFQNLCDQEFSCELNQTNNHRINIVHKYVQEHYLEKITLTDVAEQVNMNKDYFSRFFAKVMKKPFFEFLNEYKINVACKLLIETDMQISEICYASGFSSIPFFYRQFKKYKDCQPKLYRRQYLKVSGKNYVE